MTGLAVDDLETLSDRALAGFFVDSVVRLGGRTADGDVLMFDGGDPSLRGAIRLAATGIPPAPHLLAGLREFLGPSAASAHLVVCRAGPDDDLAGPLEADGYRAGMELAGMVLTAPPGAAADPSGASLVRVSTSEDVTAFRAIVSEAFPADAPAVQRIFAQHASLLNENVVAFVARVGTQPVAAAMVAVHDGVGALDWVGTRVAYRGRGLAEATTRAVARASFDAGATAVALQAAHDAARLYARIGFRPVRRYRWWQSAATPGAR